jgi:hypothetical protein
VHGTRGSSRVFAFGKVGRVANLERYIIATQDGKYLCPVCGHSGAFNGRHFTTHGGLIGSGICFCCHFEPGFDDDPLASAAAKATVPDSIRCYRDDWIKVGQPWRGQISLQPENWNADYQLAALFAQAPFLLMD